MTLTRRGRGAWPIVGAAIVFAAATGAVARPQSARPSPPAAGIEGRILTEGGAPVPAVMVEALVSRFEAGHHALVPEASAMTDERGGFRLTGLAPGRYYVAARHPSSTDVAAGVRFAPTYYPGVSVPDDARPVVVGGESSPAPIEFRLKAVRLARVSGRLTTSDGRQLLGGAVVMAPLGPDGAPPFTPSDVRIAPDGTFTFGQVPPGRYRIRARGQTVANGASLFASYGLIVEGRDVENILLTLRPGGTLDGQVTVDPRRRGDPPSLASLRVRAPLIDGTRFGDAWTGAVRRDGRFVLRSLMAGEHYLVVDGLPPPWIVQSVLLRGRELADDGVDVGEGQDLRGARIWITDRASEVTGRVTDRAGAANGVAVLVYSAAPQFWRPGHRRMRLVRTDAEGRFVVQGLPQGDYLAVASAALDEGDAGRRPLLEALRRAATAFSIAAAEARVTVDLAVLAALPGAPEPAR